MNADGPAVPQGWEKPRFVPHLRTRDELPVVALSVETISEFLEWAANVPTGHKDVIREQIAKVADDDALVAALCEELLSYKEGDPVLSFLLLSTIGETRNPRAVPSLVKLLWIEPEGEPSPSQTSGLGDVSGTDMLIGLQARAVEMLAHIGGEDTDRAVLDAVNRHPSGPVRYAAIDAYLFNRDDSSEAQDRLREVAEPRDAKFIGLPRFHRQADPEDFEKRVQSFYETNRDEIPPVPSIEPPPRRGKAAPPSVARRQPRKLT